MFRLKVKEEEHKRIKDRLNLVETPKYEYVLTDDKDLSENDKINIVFNTQYCTSDPYSWNDLNRNHTA